MRTEPFVIVSGEMRRQDGTVNVIAEAFVPLRPPGAVALEAHNFGYAPAEPAGTPSERLWTLFDLNVRFL